MTSPFRESRRRHAAVLGALGAATGVATGLILELADQLAYGEAVARIGPGLVFGVVLGGYLHWTVARSPARWLAVAVLAAVSWNLAVPAAVRVYEWTDAFLYAGFAGGVIGAAIVAGAVAVLYAPLRRWRPLALAIGLGTLTGALLGDDPWDVWDEAYDLYVVWQACVAASIGWAIPRRTS